jgi:hypothetical protein
MVPIAPDRDADAARSENSLTSTIARDGGAVHQVPGHFGWPVG